MVSIFTIQHLEIDAQSAFDSLPLFVDLEMRGCDAAKLLPGVWGHIQQSDHCRDVYECLRAVAEMECTDCLPRPNFNDLFND